MDWLNAAAFACAIGVSGCGVANLGRTLSPAVQPSPSESIPAENLVLGSTPQWVRQVLPFSNANGAALVPAQDGSLLLVVGGGIARSTDLGRSWDIVPAPRPETLYSNDGGKRFVELATARRSWFLKPVEDAAFETIATELVGARLYVLSRGASSRRLSSIPVAPGAGQSFHRVFSADGPVNACLASAGARVLVGGVLGRTPLVFESTDEGRAWRPAWRGKENDPLPVAMTFVDASRGCLLIGDGCLLRTLDGCETWLVDGAVPLDCVGDATAMGWADDRVGYVVGRGGMIVATRDGGRNWARCRTTSTADLYAVLALSHDEAWAVGSAGTILRTQNGGATWSRVDLGIGEDIRSISQFERSVWIVGDGSLWIFPVEE